MSSFVEYELQRQRLQKRCDEVLRIWDKTRGSRTEVEELLESEIGKDASSVEQFIKEARQRLASSTVEVGVFGSIKRGKSTLINALVGSDISPMRVTPETAVPVWIENGDTETKVVLLDGTILSDLSLEDARTMATQRYKPARSLDKPLRVQHKLRIPWLPKGVRIIDTPGLDDPSMAEDYEKLTLAELDRVAATIFVVVSPPGLSGEEIRVLKTLSERAVDKLFLVCNFYPDHWDDLEIREQMVEYIERIVAEGAGSAIDSSDVRVYPISAKMGFKAAVAEDHEKFEESGVAQLRRDLEKYLSAGALDRMLSFVEYRIRMSAQIVCDLLIQRKQLLLSPELIKPFATKLSQEIQNSKLKLKELEQEIKQSGKSLTTELSEIICGPLVNAISACASATKKNDLEVISHRLRLQFETASSEASQVFDQRSGYEFARLHRQLFDSFGVEERIRTAGTDLNLTRLAAEIAPSIPKIDMDKTAVAAGGLATGGVVGLLGGALAGGAGLALLATGPVGWLVGLALGSIFGMGAGGVAARILTKDTLSEEHRKAVTDELSANVARVRSEISRATNNWASEVVQNLESFRNSFFSEQERELGRLKGMLEDVKGRESSIAKIDTLMDDLQDLVR